MFDKRGLDETIGTINGFMSILQDVEDDTYRIIDIYLISELYEHATM